MHICTEMAPVVSVGSLASYVTGLSCALQRKGNLVEVILPKYTETLIFFDVRIDFAYGICNNVQVIMHTYTCSVCFWYGLEVP